METYEKEEVFGDELHTLIDRFTKEYQVTYAQIIGILEVVKAELIYEAFIEDDE
jgi:hypothetical protein